MAMATFSHHNLNAVNRNRDMCENDTTKSSTLMHKKQRHVQKNDHINFGNGLCNGEKRQICDMLTSMLIYQLFDICKILQVEKN